MIIGVLNIRKVWWVKNWDRTGQSEHGRNFSNVYNGDREYDFLKIIEKLITAWTQE